MRLLVVGAFTLLCACEPAETLLSDHSRDKTKIDRDFVEQADAMAGLAETCGFQRFTISRDILTGELRAEWNPSEDGIDQKLRCLYAGMRTPPTSTPEVGNKNK